MSGLLRSILFSTLLIYTLGACKNGELIRPFGYVRLNQVRDYLGKDTFIEELRLLVHGGKDYVQVFSAVEPETLKPLEKVMVQNKSLLRVPDTGILYALDGTSVSGRERPLTKFKAYLDESALKRAMRSSKDGNLVVIVGSVASQDWRLKVTS